jgi:O-antigen/teichoic acid export membrane protein
MSHRPARSASSTAPSHASSGARADELEPAAGSPAATPDEAVGGLDGTSAIEGESSATQASPAPNGSAGLGGRVAQRVPQLAALARSDTGRAAALAGAMLGNNAIALVTTVVFARMLGASGYGSLGALLAAFVILMVPGSALQATVAREVSRELAAGSEVAGAGVHRWMTHLTAAFVAVVAVALLLREQIAAAVGVPDVAWAAAATLPTGWLWLMLSVQRGALQAVQRYRLVGLTLVAEAALRLVFGAALVIAGLGVTGAFLGTTLALGLLVVAYTVPLRRLLPPPRNHAARELVPGMGHLLARARVPVAAFVLIAVLQHVDVIIVKHVASPEKAGSYAAASVAAKAVIWLAMGLGFYLLPEAVRRAGAGEDARPILVRTLGLLALVAVPLVGFYALLARPLLSAVFGPGLTAAAGALALLTGAMALLACGYLAVQYLLAVGRRAFIGLLAAAAAVELVVLPSVSSDLTEVALVLLGLQVALAGALLVTAALTRRGDSPAVTEPVAVPEV